MPKFVSPMPTTRLPTLACCADGSTVHQSLVGFPAVANDELGGFRDAGTDLAIGESKLPVRQSMVHLTSDSRVLLLPMCEGLPKVLAEFSTEPAPGQPVEGRWTRLRVTQVGPSRYLCEKVRGPEPLEERTVTVNNLESAKAFFGGGWVVKELFAILDPVRYPRWPE